jgi:hypothetical protein
MTIHREGNGWEKKERHEVDLLRCWPPWPIIVGGSEKLWGRKGSIWRCARAWLCEPESDNQTGKRGAGL